MIYTPPVDNVVTPPLDGFTSQQFFTKTSPTEKFNAHQNQERFLGIPRQQDSITRFPMGCHPSTGGPLPPFWQLHDAVSQPLWPGSRLYGGLLGYEMFLGKMCDFL